MITYDEQLDRTFRQSYNFDIATYCSYTVKGCGLGDVSYSTLRNSASYLVYKNKLYPLALIATRYMYYGVVSASYGERTTVLVSSVY